MEYGGEQSLNDMIEKRKEDGLKAFPAASIEKVALHVARGLQVNYTDSPPALLTYVITGSDVLNDCTSTAPLLLQNEAELAHIKLF